MLYPKRDGQPAYLCRSAHAISENSHGLVMAVSAVADGPAGEQSLAMFKHLKRRHKIDPLTLGVDSTAFRCRRGHLASSGLRNS